MPPQRTAEIAKKIEAAREELAGLGSAHIALPARFHFDPVDPVHIANVSQTVKLLRQDAALGPNAMAN